MGDMSPPALALRPCIGPPGKNALCPIARSRSSGEDDDMATFRLFPAIAVI